MPAPVAPVGALSFYDSRHNDFGTRYADCGLTAPDYYLSYGRKYIERFTNDTSARLTPEGQAWLARARVNLQVAIENQRAADPAAFDQLEKNNGAFRAFAYGTHADAYWNAGLGELNLFDLATIGLTPDVEDLFSFDGLTQTADIGTRLLGTWGEDAVDYMAGEGTADELVEAAYEGFEAVGDGIDEVFGEGATDVLLEGADELGADALELAEDVHGAAADAFGYVEEGIDSVYGEGTVSETLNDGREWLQDSVEDVEDVYESAGDWASSLWDDLL